MPSLKEVKNRIASVQSTRKITSAMKMVASSKLHRASVAIERMRPYEEKLTTMLRRLLSSTEGCIDSPYTAVRPAERVAVVLVTSNSSLCGGFNGNAIRRFRSFVAQTKAQGQTIARVYAIGKRGAEAVRKDGFSLDTDHASLLDHPKYEDAAKLADELMEMFAAGQIDACHLIYHHFKSSATQELRLESYLPLVVDQAAADGTAGQLDYIVEPSPADVVRRLLPGVIRLQLFTAVLDSLASEHAARVIAMQVATDNADELLHELSLQYNKTRQAAITAELLDIVGGSLT